MVEDQDHKNLEDNLINSFIEEEVGIVFNPISFVSSKYGKGDDNYKKSLNTKAYKVYADAYEDMKSNHPSLQNINFTNWVKIFNPYKEYKDYLRLPSPDKQNPAYLWHDQFGQDVSAMRLAALEGYQERIENIDSTPSNV